MSAATAEMSPPSQTLERRDLFGRAPLVALVVGIVGLAACAVGAFVDPRQFFFSYLVGFLFWLGLSLGCLCVLMLHHLTGGGWGYVIQRFLQAAVMLLPLMALFFVPICFGLHYLYPWAQPHEVSQELTLQRRHALLNVPMFFACAVVTFGCWIALALLLNRWSFAQDRTTDPAPTRRLRTLSGPGVVLFTLITTLALVEWVMVLEPVFYSTIFPAQIIIGWILAAFAFSLLLLTFVHEREPWRGVVRTEHFHSLGNFLLAFVMMWAYLAVSQLIIIWSGNLPSEIGWYLHRVSDGWKVVTILLGLGNFFLPFCLLLSRENKENVAVLRLLACGLLAVHALDVFWQVEPSLHTLRFYLSWMDVAALLGIGGIWLAVFFARLRTRALLPKNDPRMPEALAHGH